MVFLGFGYVCKKVNIFLYFRNKIMLKINVCLNVSERCFLWFKIGPGFMGSLAYSLEVVVALSAMRMTETLT
jgi:hypothetical protein